MTEIENSQVWSEANLLKIKHELELDALHLKHQEQMELLVERKEEKKEAARKAKRDAELRRQTMRAEQRRSFGVKAESSRSVKGVRRPDAVQASSLRVQAARDLAMDEAAAKVQHVYRRRSSIATSLERRASLKPAETQRVLQQVDELAEDVDVFVNVEVAERDEAVRKLQNAMKRRATRKEEQLRRQMGGL